jgi:hypothetical protein
LFDISGKLDRIPELLQKISPFNLEMGEKWAEFDENDPLLSKIYNIRAIYWYVLTGIYAACMFRASVTLGCQGEAHLIRGLGI